MDVEFERNDGASTSSREWDKFIPVRKEDLFGALVKQGDFADTAECELFRRLARTLRTICHYEYSETLDRLRDDYYYFSPEVAGLAAADRAKSDIAYDDLIRSLDKVLKDANFEELPHEEVADAHRRRTVPVQVKAKHDDFREVRFYRRGRHVEDATQGLGWRARTVKIEVFDDLVLLVAMKTQAEIKSRRELRTLKRRKIVPGSVLLKYFRNIACGDLYALFPNARVVMSNFDKAFLGVPAIVGGIPILLNLYATIFRPPHRDRSLSRRIRLGRRYRDENCARRLDGDSGAWRFCHAAAAEISTPIAHAPYAAGRRHLLPQRQQQCRHFRLFDQHGRGPRMQAGTACVSFHSQNGGIVDDRRNRGPYRGVARGKF